MIRALIALFAAGMIFMVGWGATMPARADTAIVSATVENGYPKNLTFKLSARSDLDITDVALSYAITGRGTSALGKPDSYTPGKQADVQVVVQVNSGQSYIPAGSEFKYHWEVTTADGKTTSSAETTYLFLPAGQDWKTVKGDFMIVYYHGDKESLASTYLKAGQETYQKIGKDLLNTTLKQVPVRVILFDNEKEMDPARPGAGAGRFDAAVTTCGTKVTNDIVLVIPVSCGSSDRTDTLRHEFGHILNEAAGMGPLGKLPSWLDEGTAVYAQLTPGGGYTGAFEAAVRSNRLIPFAQMGVPSSDANTVNLFYGEAYAMAKYLVDKGGPAQFARLFATIQKGTRFDDALKQVYGLDMAGFEKEFLAANGAASPSPTVAPTAKPQQAQPTSVPTPKPGGSTANGSKSDSVSGEVFAIAGVAVLFALAAVFLYLLSLKQAAKRRAGAAGNAGPPHDWSPPDGS